MNLFDPVAPPDRWHQHFRTLTRPGNEGLIDVIQDWARGFVDRDGKFVHEFQTTFNSSFWELYVFAVLKRYGMTPDFSHASPDFFVSSHGFNVEATIASNAKGAPAEHEGVGTMPPEDLNAHNLRTILRLSGSMTAKYEKYLNAYQSLGHVRDRPFVIAVSNFNQPYAHLAAHRPIEAVLLGYYVDEDAYMAAGRPGGVLEGHDLERVFKENGSSVELGMFRSPAFKEISAVVFNACGNMGKVRALSQAHPNVASVFHAFRLNPHSDRPHVIQKSKSSYEESLIDGLRVYHNPFAMNPLDPALFRHPSVFQTYFVNGEPYAEQREGQLQCRFVMTAHGQADE